MNHTERCGVCGGPCAYDPGFGGRMLCPACLADLRGYCASFGTTVYDYARVERWLAIVLRPLAHERA